MKKYQVFICTLIVLGLFVTNIALGLEVESIQVWNYGLYRSTEKNTISFVKKVDEINVEIGDSLGVAYTIHGSPKGGKVDIIHKIIPPVPLGSNRIVIEQKRTRRISKTTASLCRYEFDEKHKIVPGILTFQIIYNDQVLLEKKIMVK